MANGNLLGGLTTAVVGLWTLRIVGTIVGIVVTVYFASLSWKWGQRD